MIVFALLANSAFAGSGSIKLLAVRESSKGSVADLSLELQPGKGRVFIQTFPLTQLDTQISTRFAKEIACSLLDADCSSYDFVYTIRSDSTIVGGPSAGAAIAVLTTALLSGSAVRNDIAITGTINSGGLIGPVGSVREKIEAGFNSGLKRVLIPKGERYLKGNLTVDLVEYGRNLGIDVIEVSDLREALLAFTGLNLSRPLPALDVDRDYRNTMGFLGELLCNRTGFLQKELMEQRPSSAINPEFVHAELGALNLSSRGRAALDDSRFYSAASYCFGANVRYMSLLLKLKNLSNEGFNAEVLRIQGAVSRVEAALSGRNISTITDLQAFAVVSERLLESRDYLDRALNSSDTGLLAYGIERLYSAGSWSYFFGLPGRAFNLNRDVLRDSCLVKISEAQERIHYVNLYLPLQGSSDDVDRAGSYLYNSSFALCLFKASEAKAEADAVLGLIGVDESRLNDTIEAKLLATKRNIAEQSAKGVFPILGYSYYEYADSLKSADPLSSLLYLEYALELSNLDVYFKDGRTPVRLPIDDLTLAWFVAGIILGTGLALLIKNRKNPVNAPLRQHLRGKKR